MQGTFSAYVFYQEPKNVRAVARGDDFAVRGMGRSLDWLREVL